MISTAHTYPDFVFWRLRDLEAAGGHAVVCKLFVPKADMSFEDAEILAAELLDQLLESDCEGFIGWPDGYPPDDAVDIHDNSLMLPWVKGCHVLDVRLPGRRH